MDKTILTAEERKIFGRKIKGLRKTGLIPSNIFGKKIKSVAISVNEKEFSEVFEKTGETALVTLVLKGKGDKKEERAVLVTNIQNDPVSGRPLHVDFHQVDLKEKVTASVPVEVQGESPAEKTGIGTVVQYINEIEVEALPQDLPEDFIVDASIFEEVEQAVQIKDLAYDKTKVTIEADPETIVAKVEPLRKEEEEPVAETPEGEEGEAPEEAAEQDAQQDQQEVQDNKETE